MILRPDTIKAIYIYANRNKIKYNDGVYFNLNEQNLELLTYQVGLSSEAALSGTQTFYSARLSQGL